MKISRLRRLANWLIDLIAIGLLFAVLVRLPPANLVPIEHLRWLLIGVAYCYYVLSESLFQRTLGKWLTRSTVVNLQDEKPGFGRILLRSLCRFLPLEPLSIFLSRKDLCWHDSLSGTRVISFGY